MIDFIRISIIINVIVIVIIGVGIFLITTLLLQRAVFLLGHESWRRRLDLDLDIVTSVSIAIAIGVFSHGESRSKIRSYGVCVQNHEIKKK